MVLFVKWITDDNNLTSTIWSSGSYTPHPPKILPPCTSTLSKFFLFLFLVQLVSSFYFLSNWVFCIDLPRRGYFWVNFMFSCFCCWDNNRYMPFFGSLYEKLGTFSLWVVYEYHLMNKVAKICLYKGCFLIWMV